MAQISLRIPDELAKQAKVEARRQQTSLNSYITRVLTAATDPDTEASEVEVLRSRLRRAGLLAKLPAYQGKRPDPAELERARAAAGKGTSLSDLVIEGRG